MLQFCSETRKADYFFTKIMTTRFPSWCHITCLWTFDPPYFGSISVIISSTGDSAMYKVPSSWKTLHSSLLSLSCSMAYSFYWTPMEKNFIRWQQSTTYIILEQPSLILPLNAFIPLHYLYILQIKSKLDDSQFLNGIVILLFDYIMLTRNP